MRKNVCLNCDKTTPIIKATTYKVLGLLKEGCRDGEISRLLPGHISMVQYHLSILRKLLGVTSRIEVVVESIRLGLIDLR